MATAVRRVDGVRLYPETREGCIEEIDTLDLTLARLVEDKNRAVCNAESELRLRLAAEERTRRYASENDTLASSLGLFKTLTCVLLAVLAGITTVGLLP